MIPGAHLYYDFQISDGKKVVMRSRKRKCHSFVKQFAQGLLVSMSGGIDAAIMKDIANTSRTPGLLSYGYYDNTNSAHYESAWGANLSGPVNTATYGPVLGSGTNAVDISDYKLQTLIAHGTSSGQLQYSATVFGPPFTDTTTSYIVVTRVFTNASGGNVSVNEIGLYAQYYDALVGLTSFCIVRDKLPATITIPNGSNLTLNYTIKVII